MDDVSAREFGRLEAQVDALQNEVSDLRKDVKCLLELANKSKGGFWMGTTKLKRILLAPTGIGQNIT